LREYRMNRMKRYPVIMSIMILWCLSWAPGVAWAQNQKKAAHYLWYLINEARDKPMAVIERLGLDEAKARLALGEDEWILDRGLQPVALNGQLFESAWNHSEDMIGNLYYSYVSPDGRTVEDRVADTGYEAVSTGESLGALVFQNFIDPMDAAAFIFLNLVRDELDPDRNQAKNIFSPEFRELGITFSAATLDVGERLPVYVYVVVADFADPVGLKAYVIGNVFKDLNGNGFLDPGEGVSGLKAIARPFGSSEGGTSVVTGVLGEYQLELPTGFVNFQIKDETGKVLKRQFSFAFDENRLLDVWLK
jgi:Cysteine-rich secretory protein family